MQLRGISVLLKGENKMHKLIIDRKLLDIQIRNLSNILDLKLEENQRESLESIIDTLIDIEDNFKYFPVINLYDKERI